MAPDTLPAGEARWLAIIPADAFTRFAIRCAPCALPARARTRLLSGADKTCHGPHRRRAEKTYQSDRRMAPKPLRTLAVRILRFCSVSLTPDDTKPPTTTTPPPTPRPFVLVMCITCAKRFLNRLDLRRRTNPTGSWYICLLDHVDHVHIRVDGIHQPSDWVQVSSTHDDLLRALADLDIPHSIHLHETAAGAGGCSDAVIGALHRETLDTEQAAVSAATEDACAVCYDIFAAGDEVLALPCSHRYHSACVTPWLRKATSCPTCRTTISRAAVGLSDETVTEVPILRHHASPRASPTRTSRHPVTPPAFLPPRPHSRHESPERRARPSSPGRGSAPAPPRRRGIRRIASWVSNCRGTQSASDTRRCPPPTERPGAGDQAVPAPPVQTEPVALSTVVAAAVAEA